MTELQAILFLADARRWISKARSFNADTVGAFLSLGGAKPYSLRLRAKLSPGRAQMFLGQSHDASVKSQERSTEPSLRLLRCSAPHERMDATGKRAARNVSGHHKRNEKRRARSDAPYRNCVCGATTGKQWALLAINKNPKRAAQLKVQFNLPGAKQPLSFVGQVEVIQFSRQQYAWHDDGQTATQSAACRQRNSRAKHQQAMNSRRIHSPCFAEKLRIDDCSGTLSAFD